VFFPEFLYQLAERDQQTTWLDPFIARRDLVAALATVDNILTPANDRAFVLQSLLASFSPGAAQNINAAAIGLMAPAGGTVIVLDQLVNALGVGAQQVLRFSGSLVISQGWRLMAQGQFNAGVAGNSVNINAVGMLIPPGNMQRV